MEKNHEFTRIGTFCERCRNVSCICKIGKNTSIIKATLFNEVEDDETKPCTIPNVVHHVKITDFIGEKVWFDDAGAGYIWAVDKDGGHQKLADLRGWGAIQNLFKNKGGSIDFKKAEDFQDALGHWIADAIQQKLEKERA